MRYSLLLLLLPFLLLSGCLNRHKSEELGSVLVIKRIHLNKSREFPAVSERDLGTGKTALLIQAGFALKGWKGYWPPERMTPSMDGQYIYLFVSDPEWCGVWCRESGQVRSLGDTLSSEDYPEYFMWMPKGCCALIERGEKIFNARNGKIVARAALSNESFAVPSGKGNGIIVVTHPDGWGGCSDVHWQNLSGKTRFLFRWPVPIQTIAQSPDETHMVIADTRSCFITDAKGKHLSRFGLRARNSIFDTIILFNKSGNRVVAQGNGQLWVSDMKSGKARRIDKLLTVQVPAMSTASFGRIEGWLQDGKSIVISNVIAPDDNADPEKATSRFMFWSYDTTESKPPGRLIYDSGETPCESVVWYPNKQ